MLFLQGAFGRLCRHFADLGVGCFVFIVRVLLGVGFGRLAVAAFLSRGLLVRRLFRSSRGCGGFVSRFLVGRLAMGLLSGAAVSPIRVSRGKCPENQGDRLPCVRPVASRVQDDPSGNGSRPMRHAIMIAPTDLRSMRRGAIGPPGHAKASRAA